MIYPLIFNRKYNNPSAYLVTMKPPLTPKSYVSALLTSDATGQNSQFLGVLYLALTGLIDSALSEAGPWAVAGNGIWRTLLMRDLFWLTLQILGF
ncbi:hypothetical protein DSO57_1011410 [Entomophthora muscae]|uniref:Uncharacterized protein n=1 Tax=Entomophthora muscae TaxID=34485 RepID=A0ACC2UFV8_9FUNG|nr:hypothetical protein DSO57_1011410 [Entomophthora muscae]